MVSTEPFRREVPDSHDAQRNPVIRDGDLRNGLR
jgi:hypothetical protein